MCTLFGPTTTHWLLLFITYYVYSGWPYNYTLVITSYYILCVLWLALQLHTSCYCLLHTMCTLVGPAAIVHWLMWLLSEPDTAIYALVHVVAIKARYCNIWSLLPQLTLDRFRSDRCQFLLRLIRKIHLKALVLAKILRA